MRIPLKATKKTIGDFTVESQIQIPGSSSVIYRARDDKEINRPAYLRMLTHFTPEQREAYLKKVARYSQTPHPSILKWYDAIATVDGEVIAAAFEPYQENLHDFITRRLQNGMYLTAAEILWVSRQLVAALAVWFSPGFTHGTICSQNIVIARNGQNQLVFKIGIVQDEDLVQQFIPGQNLEAQQRIDMFDVGIVLYQILTLNLNVDIITPERYVPGQQTDAKMQQQPQLQRQNDPMPLLNRIRAELQNPDSDVRKRYRQISSALDIVLQMIDPVPTQRPIPKNVQIGLAAIDLRDFEGTASDLDECIVPAGSGDAVVKTAQLGYRESQYQLSLLLRERGHSAQCVAWVQKAAEQGHVRATALLGLHLRKGEGCSKDLEKAELWLRKSAVKDDIQAQQFLSDVLWDAGKIDELARLSQQGIALSEDVEAELGLMSLFGYGGIAQDEKTAQQYLQRCADRGNATAQLFLASLLTEPELSQSLLESTINRADQYISQKKLRFVLAAVMACLKGKSGISAIVHPAELKVSDFETADAKAVSTKAVSTKADKTKAADEAAKTKDAKTKEADAKEVDVKTADTKAADTQAADAKVVDAKAVDAKKIIRCKLRGKEEVEVRPLHEDISEALKELLIRDNWPAYQGHLQIIRGFCGGFDFNNRSYPLVMVVSHVKQGPVKDFFSNPKNRGRAADLLLPWAIHLASAIESLHSENLVHGDISARTVLINENESAILAVSDHLCYEQENLPVRVRRDADKRLSYHLPLNEKTISKASDIFAFGLTLLEIATEGNHSLYDWTVSISDDSALLKTFSNSMDSEDYENLISTQLPSSVPAALKELILQCVHRDPLKRPTAFALVEKLGELTQQNLIHANSSDSTKVKKLYEIAVSIKDTNPKFAFVLFRHAAAIGHRSSMLQAAEMLWLGEQVPADRESAKELAYRYCALVAKSNGSNVIEEKYQTAISFLANKETLRGLMGAYFASSDVRNLIMDYVAFQKPSYSFALTLLGESADSGHTLAQEKVAEMLWSGKGAPQDKALAIKYFSKVVATKPEYLERLDQMRVEYRREQSAMAKESEAQTPSQSFVEQKSDEAGTQQKETPAGQLRTAFHRFFGLDVLRDLDVVREYLVKASVMRSVKRQPIMDLLDAHIPSSGVRGIIAEYAREPEDPNTLLARAILSLSTNPLDEKCPLRFFVPGGDFQPPFVELETSVYRVPGRAFRCSIVGRIGVLLSPDESTDLVAWLNRNAHAHPNVIGPIGMTAGVRVLSSTGVRKTLPIALLYSPVQAAPADRAMIADPTTALSRLLPFLVGVAEGLAHLHRSNVVHGNISLPYLLVGHDRLGLVAVGPPSCKRATAPESLGSGQFTAASDVFQFGRMVAHMLTGWEDGWLSQTEDMDSKTHLARLSTSAASGYADIRARIPQWCPQPLVDIMLRCLRVDRTQRPAMDAVATEIQTLRSTMAHSGVATVGPRPAQFWMHTSHICLELTADDPMIRTGGIFEILYGPRIRDRLQKNFNPATQRSKTITDKKAPGVMHSRSFGTTTGPSSILAYPNLAAGTRKIIEYKSRFFTQTELSSWDGSEVLPRGIRHFPSYARGPILLEDRSLTAHVNRLDKPPQYPKDQKWCTGAPDKCNCERASRPKNPGVVTKIPTKLLRLVMSFLEFPDYGSLARVCRITAKEAEENMIYWHNIIKKFGNQEGQTFVPRDLLIEMGGFDPLFRRWAKAIAAQEIYTRAYTSFQLETTDVLYIPDITREERKHLIDKAHNEYKAKTHACSCCHKPVPFAQYFKDDKDDKDAKDKKDIKEGKDDKSQSQSQSHDRKALGSVFMACNDCLAHNAWSTVEATTLWGFTSKQLDKIPFWHFGTERRFATADLLDFRMKFPMLRKLKKPKKIDTELYNRVPDLPDYVKEYVIINPPHSAIQVKSVTQPTLEPTAAMSVLEFDTESMFDTGDERPVVQQLSTTSAREEKGLTVDLEAFSATSFVVGTVATSESTAETSSATSITGPGSSGAADSTASVGSASLVEVVYTVFYRKKPEQQQTQPGQAQLAAPKSESASEAMPEEQETQQVSYDL